jgi:predicted dienelactone hydrolase
MLLAAAAAVPGRSWPASGRADFEWVDTQRRRVLPLRVHWPDGDAPCPLVLYSHGLGGSRDGGDAWAAAWREAGLAVLQLQHPGSDREVLAGGWRALRAAAGAEQLLARVADLRFVLDELYRRQAEPPWARVRLDAIGLAGHSFGAVTTQALAGQRYAASVSLADARLAAFVAFSPSPARGSMLSMTQQFGAIGRPMLCITGSRDDDPLGEGMTAARRAAVFDGLPAGRGRRALLWLEGADHMSLAGNAALPIGWAGAGGRRDTEALRGEHRVHALAAWVSALWWLRWLAGERMADMTLHAVPGRLDPGDRWVFD